MCRNIKTLYNFEPSATKEEIYNASLQFVRKISGFKKPSRVNETTFYDAVNEISRSTHLLLSLLQTSAFPRNREEEVKIASARAKQRFGK